MKLSRSLAAVATLAIGASLFSASGAFADTSGDYTYSVNGDQTATITGYAGSATDITIPASLNSHSVTDIGNYAFNAKSLTKVTIPNSVITVGEAAFYDNAITDVSFGINVTTISRYAFFGNKLSSVTIPSDVATIDENAFGQNSTLASVLFDGNAPSLGGNAFDSTNAGFAVSHYSDSTGFGRGSTWNGYSLNVVFRNPTTTSAVTAGVTAGVRSAGLTTAAFDAVSFSHAQQSVNTNVTLSVDDLTGANAGWNVTTVASDLTWSAVTGGPNTGSNLPASALAVTSVGQISTVAGDAWTGDTNTGALSSPVKVLSTSGGSGSYTAPLTLTLTVPGQASVGTYAGTLTTTISAAP